MTEGGNKMFSGQVTDQFNPPPDHRHTGLTQEEIAEKVARYEWRETDKEVAVGDLGSDEVGSGARMNGGKPAVELVPVSVWLRVLRAKTGHDPALPPIWWEESLGHLAHFQEGRDNAIFRALSCASPETWDACCAVFDYGRNKYAEWNWLKGMKWSIPIACAIRHVRAMIERSEVDDQESGLPHAGHYLCNLVMLATYVDTYRAGDDRPSAKYFGTT